MKNFVMISLLAVMAAMPASAQHGGYRAPVRGGLHRSFSAPRHRSSTDIYYGLRLGVTASTVRSDDKYLDGSRAMAGLNLGMAVGFQLARATPVYLETGLYYTEKGGKGNYNGPFSYSMNYLEVPIVMKYLIRLNPDVSIQPFAGVFGAVGVTGKIKDFNQRQAYSSFDSDAFKRVDGGLRLGCGIQYSHFYAELGYDIGLVNVSHDYFDSSHTGCFFANFGVNF